MEFKAIDKAHLNKILDIYNYYVVNSTATFHLYKVSLEKITSMVTSNHPRFPSWVIIDSKQIVGFCLLHQYSDREAYDCTAEVSIYLSPDCVGRGIGRASVEFLEQNAKSLDFRTLIARISAENTKSIELFEKAGYFHCGLYKEVGIKFGRVLDVVLMQKLI